MQTWQTMIVALVAVVCVGYMTFTIVRLLYRTTDLPAQVRPTNDLEAGFVGAMPEAGEQAYDAFSYRTTARYAGRARVVLREDSLTVAGPRAPRSLYVLWIWLQGITLALVPVALVLAVIKLDWRALLLAGGIMVVSALIMAIGAGVWPGMGETLWVGENRFDATEIPLSSISNVTLGENWARDGLRLVIAPYAGGIDKIARGRAVCFNAPDGEGHYASYAVHMLSEADAAELYEALKTGASE